MFESRQFRALLSRLAAAATLAAAALIPIPCAAQTPSAPAASAPFTTPASSASTIDATTPSVATGAQAATQKPTGAPAAASTDNPYGIEALWKGSDDIARSVLVILAIMSAGSWYILITKFLEQAKMNRHARTVDLKFWVRDSVSAAAGSLEKSSAYRFIAEAGIAATSDHNGLKRHIPTS